MQDIVYVLKDVLRKKKNAIFAKGLSVLAKNEGDKVKKADLSAIFSTASSRNVTQFFNHCVQLKSLRHGGSANGNTCLTSRGQSN